MKEINDKCPYCGKKMEKGKIVGDRYRLRWADIKASDWKAFPGVGIGEGGFLFGRPTIKGYFCENCLNIIIPLEKPKRV